MNHTNSVKIEDIWGPWCQRQVSQAGISNCIPQYVGCNYLSMPEKPASGAEDLISTTKRSTTSPRAYLVGYIVYHQPVLLYWSYKFNVSGLVIYEYPVINSNIPAFYTDNSPHVTDIYLLVLSETFSSESRWNRYINAFTIDVTLGWIAVAPTILPMCNTPMPSAGPRLWIPQLAPVSRSSFLCNGNLHARRDGLYI